MIVYRQQQRTEASGSLLRHIQLQLASLRRQSQPARDDLLAVLIDAGEWAAAVADARLPEGDTIDPVADAALTMVVHLARACDGEWRGEWPSVPSAIEAAHVASHRVETAQLPKHVTVRVSEGFAYYALSPHLYGDAVREWSRCAKPKVVWCIGLRTIGLTLAAVAAAALQNLGASARALSLRPIGHPFDRRVLIGEPLADALRSTPDAWWLVVDEGPGISGSSMAGTARALADLGIPSERIVMMPSYTPDVERLSPRARDIWRQHTVAAVNYDRTWIETDRLARERRAARLVDIAGGGWRSVADLEGAWPAVNPDHERRKYLAYRDHQRAMLKFAGYGRYGRTLFQRAAHAASEGWGPAPVGLEDGWIEHQWLDERFGVGQVTTDDLRRLGDYLAFIVRTRATVTRVDRDALQEMTIENVRACCGDEAAIAARALPLHEGPAAVLDNRLRPHEWVRRGAALQKTDGTEHGDDHFFPGPCDIAWDLAGAISEWRLDTHGAAAMIARYVEGSGDRDAIARLPFYHLAYRAFRAAYTAFSRDQLAGTPEGRRFAAEHEQYRRQLESVACVY